MFQSFLYARHQSGGRIRLLNKTGHYVPAQFLLTPRELTVMKLLAEGRSNKQLAGDLDMSVRTAETHRASILAKLAVVSLADLVRIAVRDEVI